MNFFVLNNGVYTAKREIKNLILSKRWRVELFLSSVLTFFYTHYLLYIHSDASLEFTRIGEKEIPTYDEVHSLEYAFPTIRGRRDRYRRTQSRLIARRFTSRWLNLSSHSCAWWFRLDSISIERGRGARASGYANRNSSHFSRHNLETFEKQTITS